MNTPATRGRAPWWATALALFAVALFCTAGFWQLSRAAEKEALLAAFASGAAGEADEGLPEDPVAENRRYDRIRIRGRFDGAHQILLDNMVHNSRPGYQVLTPLRTSSGTVLVNRGWVAGSGDRNLLPEIGVDEAPRELTGRIAPLPVPGLRLESRFAGGTTWPRRLHYPTSEELATHLGYAIRNYQILLDPDAPDGFIRAWKPAEMGPGRHLAYAVQWFGLAGAVIVVYMILAFRRPQHRIDEVDP